VKERIAAIESLIRNVPDFPKPGIQFKDITPLLGDARTFADMIELIAEPFRDKNIAHVIGIESRGFIVGAPVALKLGAGFIPVRKPGKLPAAVHRATYALEYGTDTLEMHRDAITPGARVLIVDDVIATGGTVKATMELALQQQAVVAGVAFAIELSFLNGRAKLPADVEVFSRLRY
jgi:adenine phosphoribosyltransferase